MRSLLNFKKTPMLTFGEPRKALATRILYLSRESIEEKPGKIMSCLVIIVGIFLIIAGPIYFFRGATGDEEISTLGEYQGYSEAIYDGTVRYSDYLTISNGIRLAYDLILPTRDGIAASDPLRVLFKYTPYLRTFTIFDENGKNVMADLYDLTMIEKAMLRVRYWIYERGSLMDPLFRTKWLENMIYHGYVVVVVERPGTGASFGAMDPSFEAGAREVNEILNWIAAQTWSDGNIGMYGDSWQAQIQFAAASTGNPHLKAIMPVSSSLDNYSSIIYPGGVYNKAFGGLFSQLNTMLESLVTPVDQDGTRELLTQALAERTGSTIGEKSDNVFAAYPYRDTLNSDQEKVWEDVFALYPMLEAINRSHVPIYMVNGWFDLFTKDMFLWYANLAVPKRLLVLPYDHSELEGESSDFDLGLEAHRWFDYWLKGIDSGINDEPTVHYYLMGATKDDSWQTTNQWPLAGKMLTPFYLAQGRTGRVESVNDGFLLRTRPHALGDHDKYVIDYSTTSGEFSRWSAVNWSRDYPDMQANDQKALTYTTSALESPIKVIGHPVVHIWLETDAPDLDMFVYLEEVDTKGRSTYITEGNLRAAHRTHAQPPFANFELPYFNYYESGLAPIPAWEPVELMFDLLPTAYEFHENNHIRVTIAFADADNFATPEIFPVPELRLLRDRQYPSFIELPVVELP